MCKCVFVCVCMYAAVCPGNCFMRFIAGAAVGEHFKSYFQWRETSWEKATGGSTHCCTFKGQIAHIYATAACHRPEERLFTAEAVVALHLSVFTRQEKKALGNNKKRFFSHPITVLSALFSSTVLKVALVTF